uniref:Uncharacterized protein n=1 Tax=Ralstonia solanacearum TaxID=305 RepID=A0A0S4TLM1_RALSL|nr:protein of unknown function [Ralstonia solanacearum]
MMACIAEAHEGMRRSDCVEMARRPSGWQATKHLGCAPSLQTPLLAVSCAKLLGSNFQASPRECAADPAVGR